MGILAAAIDIISDWLGDLKEGFCKPTFYLNRGFCCWGISGHLSISPYPPHPPYLHISISIMSSPATSLINLLLSLSPSLLSPFPHYTDPFSSFQFLRIARAGADGRTRILSGLEYLGRCLSCEFCSGGIYCFLLGF